MSFKSGWAVSPQDPFPPVPPGGGPFNPQNPPPYALSPTSPYASQAPPYNPQAPPYFPQAPPYAPQAPPYAPQAPQYGPQPPFYAPQPPFYAPQAPFYQNPAPHPAVPFPNAPPSSPPPPYNPASPNDVPDRQATSPAPSQFPPQPHLYQPQQQFQQPFQPQGQPLQRGMSSVSTASSPNSISFGSPVSPTSQSDPLRASCLGFEGSPIPGSLYPAIPNEVRDKQIDTPPHQWKSYPKTPLPPNLVLLWESSHLVNIFFVQQEGHVVSPEGPFKFFAYKCPPMNDVSSLPVGCLAGKAMNATVLLKVGDEWRLGLCKHRSFIVKGSQWELAFYDDSTTPARYVIVVLPREISRDDKQRLEVLLGASSFITDEPSNIIDRLETGVETVRFGGSLVSKGVHLVSDTVMDKEVPKEALIQHKELFEALKTYRLAFDNNKVETISRHS